MFVIIDGYRKISERNKFAIWLILRVGGYTVRFFFAKVSRNGTVTFS